MSSGLTMRRIATTATTALQTINALQRRVISCVYYRHTFASFGMYSILDTPCLLANTHFIHIGERSSIRKGARLECVVSSLTRIPDLHIGSEVKIDQNVHIICHNYVKIGNAVRIEPNCCIMDTTHVFDGAGDSKFGSLVLDDDARVEIGTGSQIGHGTAILRNARIGRNCVIEARSVVTGVIPDGSIASGAPARVVREIRSFTQSNLEG